jgi:hypothetical protein
MAGLVPGIHVFLLLKKQDVNGRDEPGHDDTGDNRYLFIRHCHGKRRQFKPKTLRISANAA